MEDVFKKTMEKKLNRKLDTPVEITEEQLVDMCQEAYIEIVVKNNNDLMKLMILDVTSSLTSKLQRMIFGDKREESEEE